MWIILLFACASVILPNNAQDQTTFEAQTATETPYSNNDENWEPHVKVTIKNGRTNNADRSLSGNSAHPLVYSNEWNPLIISTGFNRNTDFNSYVNENERSFDHLFVPTFLRRPDSAANNTVPYPYSQFVETNAPVFYHQIPYFQPKPNLTSDSLISNNEQLYSEPLTKESLITNEGDFQPMDVYRSTQNLEPPVILFHSASQSNLNSNDRNFEINEEPKEIASSAVPKYSNSDSVISRTSDEVSKPLPNEDHNRELEISNPINIYSNVQRYLPPVFHPYYPSYPFVPFQRDGAFQPMVPYPSIVRGFDREAGSEIDDRIPETPEKQVLPEAVPDRLEENVPSATSTDIIPPQSLPFPANGFPIPFGIYPNGIPFVPPMIPNIPAYRFAFNPLSVPQPRNVPRENIIADDSRPPLTVPITPVPKVLPEIFPENFPHIGSLAKEEQTGVLTDLQANPDEAIPDENPNATKIPYEYGFDMSDGKGNDQHRKETSDDSGRVIGSYGYRDKNGTFRMVNYIADKDGFRAFIKSNEPGVASSGSADVVVVAERPLPRERAEAGQEIGNKIIAALDPNTGVITSGRIPESK